MWCALHVKDGGEARTETFVSGLLPETMYTRCFRLTRSRRKKYGGQWRTVRENLLPGYVFIDTDQPEAVYQELKRTMGQGLLFSNDEHVTTLAVKESDFMGQITDGYGEIGLSKVCVEPDGEIRYLSGPLLHVPHLVKKVDLHKRIAEVETDFLGERHMLYLGIEIEKQVSGQGSQEV